MPKNNEIEKLVEILQTQTKTYSAKQIKSAILAEGYSEEVANAVVEKLYPQKQQKEDLYAKQKEFVAVKEGRERRLAPEPETKEEKDHFKEVDYLIRELKNLGEIKAPEIETPELFSKKELESSITTVSKEDIETKIAKLKEQIAKIKINDEDYEKVQTDKGEIINLGNYPRRDWHIYKDKGRIIAEIKEEQINKLRDEITELRRASRGGAREEIKESSSERMREKHKEKELEREYISTAAENIYTQMKKKPEAYEEEERDEKRGEKKKEEEETVVEREKKKEEIKEEEFKPEFGLDSNLEEEFNLNLNLEETPIKGKEKKKK